MLDSSHMCSTNYGRRIRKCSRTSVCFASFRCFSIGRRFSFLVLAGSLTGVLMAQSPNNLDCSDPLLADTIECSNQTSNQTQHETQSQMQPGAPGAYDATSENSADNSPSNYSDLEQFRRQASRQQPPLPLEPLTEFQKFVASTTGQI